MAREQAFDGPYLWLALATGGAGRQGWDRRAFCPALLEHTGVALTPWHGFGPAGEAGVRLPLGSIRRALAAGASRNRGALQTALARDCP